MKQTALVVGATGITASNLAKALIVKAWSTYGLSRNPKSNIYGLNPIGAEAPLYPLIKDIIFAFLPLFKSHS